MPRAKGYVGAAFDGTYVYFAPEGGTNKHGVALRFDTRKSIGDNTGWSTFDMQTAWLDAKGFAGAAFDGRYVYFIPYERAPMVADPTMSGNPTPAVLNSRLVRYDITQSFTAATSWDSFDLTQLAPGLGGYVGAVFDGEYLYLVPAESTTLLRFHARTPPGLPAQYPGTP